MISLIWLLHMHFAWWNFGKRPILQQIIPNSDKNATWESFCSSQTMVLPAKFVKFGTEGPVDFPEKGHPCESCRCWNPEGNPRNNASLRSLLVFFALQQENTNCLPACSWGSRLLVPKSKSAFLSHDLCVSSGTLYQSRYLLAGLTSVYSVYCLNSKMFQGQDWTPFCSGKAALIGCYCMKQVHKFFFIYHTLSSRNCWPFTGGVKFGRGGFCRSGTYIYIYTCIC